MERSYWDVPDMSMYKFDVNPFFGWLPYCIRDVNSPSLLTVVSISWSCPAMTGPASNPSPFWQLRRRVKKSIQLWNGPALSGPGANQKRANWSSGSEKAVCQHDPKTWRAWIVIGTYWNVNLCCAVLRSDPIHPIHISSISITEYMECENSRCPQTWLDWLDREFERSFLASESFYC